MPAVTKNLTIEQKATFRKKMTYRDTGKKPIVLLDGALRERATSEGTPVIVVDGQLRCLDTTTESLTL